MCGIAGWVNLKEDLSAEKGILREMSETLKNRGPDSNGEWFSPHAMLVHRRLAVVDPEGGLQPMVRTQGDKAFVVTYNGELYNTEDLRTALMALGHHFYTRSDTEVLLVSYLEWGPQCVEYLNGIYAFALWDEKEQCLFMARDRFGVKPLFYSFNEQNLVFGSEIKALLKHPLVKAVVKTEGLGEIFTLCPARTPGHGIYEHVFEVKPAHCVLFNGEGMREIRYWSLSSSPHEDSPEDTLEKVSWWVKDAIRRQLVSDVPLCTFLSGGLDSSIITAVAARAFNEDARFLDTFSIDYVDNEKYFKSSLFQPNADAPFVRLMSETFNTHHHVYAFDTPELVEALKTAVLARDFPGMADVDSSLYLFCREIKKTATVALSGECADEVFGGYPWFHHKEFFDAPTFPWARQLDERLKVLSPELKEQIRPYDYVRQRYEESLAQVPHLLGENATERRRREIFYLNLTWFMSTLLDRKDRMSMANGLEVRVPFCDHRLVQYVWNIPWSLKMYENREKGLLRKSLEDTLPYEILWRKKSPYPKTHNPSYTQAVKEQLSDILGDSNSPLQPLIDKKALLELLKQPEELGRPWFGQLMALPQLFAWLIQVNLWLKEYHVKIN